MENFHQTTQQSSVTDAEALSNCAFAKAFRKGYIYKGVVEPTRRRPGGELSFKVNEDGRTIAITKLIVKHEGKTHDLTKKALKEGGESVAISNHGSSDTHWCKNCRDGDKRLCWETSGRFVEWAKELIKKYSGGQISKIEKPILVSNYNGRHNGDDYFYALGNGRHWKYVKLSSKRA
ncbi:MAG: hypothetical protein AAF433_06770 [Bacteroidota bacterium]